MTTLERYEPGMKGWVGYSHRTYEGPKGQFENHAWWQGPRFAFVTLGQLGRETAVYPTRRELLEALRQHGATHLKPQKVANAEAMNLERWRAWWEQYCEVIGVRPDNRLPDKAIATRYANRQGNEFPDRPERVAEWRACWAYAQTQLSSVATPSCG
jgi:hypothetical protein